MHYKQCFLSLTNSPHSSPLVRFEMAVKHVYKQKERQADIFVIIIIEFKSRSLNFYLASDKL